MKSAPPKDVIVFQEERNYGISKNGRDHPPNKFSITGWKFYNFFVEVSV
jgi:hypothetical protein